MSISTALQPVNEVSSAPWVRKTRKTSHITCFATRTGRPLGHLENVG
jgi:hypothetical protein